MKKLLLLNLAAALLFASALPAQPGNPDPAFGGGDGIAISSFLSGGHAYPSAVALQADGRILVAGDTWLPLSGEPGQIALARYMPNGSPDPTFSGDGKLMIALGNISAGVSAIVIQPDGKFLLAGRASQGDTLFFLLIRYKADGTPDNTFDGDGIVTTSLSNFSQSASALALQPDGKIVVAGYANLSGYGEFAVLRYHANGALDNSFGGDGIVTTPVGDAECSASAVLIQPNGKIVAAGYAEINGFEDFAVVRYQANGLPDNTFSGDGIATASFTDKNDAAYDAVLQPDGKIVLIGQAGAIGTPTDSEFAVARFTSGGLLDDTFSGDGMSMIHVSDYADGARGVVLQPDGKIILGGYAHSTATGGADFGLARVTANGVPDGTFGLDGITTLSAGPSSNSITAMTRQADGKIVVVGTSWDNDRHRFGVARVLTSATVDTNQPAIFSRKISLYPNPVRERATLEYELETREKIAVNLYDLQGRFLQNLLPPTEKSAGQHAETLFFTKDLPAGQYFLAVESESGRVFHKIVL